MTTAPPTRAVANLHLHLEYDSGLDVIAAAMATIPEGDEDTDEHRGHVAGDISSAVGHLLDVDAMTPDGCPVRITDYSVDVVVEIEEPDDQPVLEGTTAEERAELETEARGLFGELGLTGDEFALIAQAPAVTDAAGPPPFELNPPLPEIPRFIAQWGIACGYLARSCDYSVDMLFDDLVEHTARRVRARGSLDGFDMAEIFLPEHCAGRYDVAFIRKLIVTMSEVTTRLTCEWEEPSNLAQVLALNLLIAQAEVMAEEDADDVDVKVASPPAEMFEALRMRLLDQELVDAIFAGDDQMLGFDYWFVPFAPGERTAPYATDYLD